MTKKIISLFLVFSFVISVVGCTKYAKQEEIQQLNNLKAEVEQLEKEIKAKEQEKVSLQNELSQKDQKLKELQAEKEKVQQRLQQQK
jgi:outer membrane murein-binding lipoprotein Lpp